VKTASFAIVLICVAALSRAAVQSGTAGSILAGVSTAEQADRGKVTYQASCASCHGANLMSRSDDAPSLSGPDFKIGWNGKTVGDLYDRVRTSMPMGAVGTLSDQQYVDIIAFVLQSNGYPAGHQELKPDPAALKQITIEPVP
jgi:mono/diheme cytochrome c family protein